MEHQIQMINDIKAEIYERAAEELDLYPIMKEKYGEIRYEFVWAWNRNSACQFIGDSNYPEMTKELTIKFDKLLREIASNYPDYWDIIMEDWECTYRKILWINS